LPETMLFTTARLNLLFERDRAHAKAVQEGGCHCGGPLYVANYRRKPQGIRLYSNSWLHFQCRDCPHEEACDITEGAREFPCPCCGGDMVASEEEVALNEDFNVRHRASVAASVVSGRRRRRRGSLAASAMSLAS